MSPYTSIPEAHVLKFVIPTNHDMETQKRYLTEAREEEADVIQDLVLSMVKRRIIVKFRKIKLT